MRQQIAMRTWERRKDQSAAVHIHVGLMLDSLVVVAMTVLVL